MTHTSQLSPRSSDYFSHKPRSFLSLHTDFDEKLSAPGSISPSPSDPRGRRPTRLLGYEPTLSTVPAGPRRVPRSRTLLRLVLLLTILGLVSLGWRCEAVGCKGRGGGALVGDYIGASTHVGGGSVVKGWGSPEGVAEGGEELEHERMDGEEVEQGQVVYELYDGSVDEPVDGAAGESAVEEGPVQTVLQQDAVSDAQSEVQPDEPQAPEVAPPAPKRSWLGSMDGLW